MWHHIILLEHRIRYVAIAILLQLKNLRVDQWIKPYIRINIRELNGELYTGLSILYT